MKLVKSIWVASVIILGDERVATLHSHVSKQVNKANVLSSEFFLDGLSAIETIHPKLSVLVDNDGAKAKNGRSKQKTENKMSTRAWHKLTTDHFKRYAVSILHPRNICFTHAYY